MSDFWYVVKDGKFLTSGAKFDDNINLANLYNDKEEAEFIAKEVGGEVIARKSRYWVVVKDGKYLSNSEEYVEDIKKAYLFSRSTAEQYLKN